MKDRICLFIGMILMGCVNSRPKIECSDLNDFSSDTSFYLATNDYRGFVFPATYQPMINVSGKRFTPNQDQIRRAEAILATNDQKYGINYHRQYLGSINSQSDSLILIRLMKNGFKEECFDKIVSVGFGEKYEKYQRITTINLNAEKIEK